MKRALFVALLLSVSCSLFAEEKAAAHCFAGLQSVQEQLGDRVGRTGSQEQVDAALKKLGQYVDNRESHNNPMLVGNDRTGLWKKFFGLARTAEIQESVASVINDSGPVR
jgi:hypothetical protein